MPEAAPTRRTREASHPGCAFCGPRASAPLALDPAPDGAGGVTASFACPPAAEGYPGLVHGGIAAGLLDAAMTNALFARGVAGLTGRLTVRYHHPLRLGRPATVAATASARRGAWWVVRGAIRQDGRAAVSAEAWFRDRAP